MLLADNDHPRKAYYVDRIARAASHLLVYADNADDALQQAKAGEGEGIDVSYDLRGYTRPRRAPGEDR